MKDRSGRALRAESIAIVCGPHRELSRGSLFTHVAEAGYFPPKQGRPRVWMLLGRGLDSDGATVTHAVQTGHGAPITSMRPGVALLPDEGGDLGYYVVTGGEDSPEARRHNISCARKRCEESWTVASEDDLYEILDMLRSNDVREVSIAELRRIQDLQKGARGRTMR